MRNNWAQCGAVIQCAGSTSNCPWLGCRHRHRTGRIGGRRVGARQTTIAEPGRATVTGRAGQARRQAAQPLQSLSSFDGLTGKLAAAAAAIILLGIQKSSSDGTPRLGSQCAAIQSRWRQLLFTEDSLNVAAISRVKFGLTSTSASDFFKV